MQSLVIGSLFSGYSGLDMAVEAVTGGTTIWHCDNDPAATKLLAYRYTNVPNLGDITAVDWNTVEPVDVICGGSPCQDVSAAGKRAGMRAGTRSGLWASMCDAIATIRPRLVVWENVRGVLSAEADSALEPCPGCVGDGDDGPVLRALGRVLGDLAELGYDTQWCGLRAADVGAPHGRFREFVMGWPADASMGRPSSRTDLRSGQSNASWSGAVREPRRWRGVEGFNAGADLLASNATGGRRNEGWTKPTWLVGGSHAAECGACADCLCADCDEPVEWHDDDGWCAGCERHCTVADAERGGRRGRAGNPQREQVGRVAAERSSETVEWGNYESAIRRWERLTRPAPLPWQKGAKGGYQLAPRFSEWMMGLPLGWVTDPDLWIGWKPTAARNAQLKLLGNGVVPQQAEAALRHMLTASEATA